MPIVLVVEDDTVLRETLAYNLKNQGLIVETVGDGRAAIETARRVHPDLILLDLMLPELDGIEVTRILRQEMLIPILMLTARDEEIDRVIGLEMGADDYIVKPFSMRELMARVKAHLRRERQFHGDADKPGARNGQVVVFGNLAIEPDRREARLDDSPLALTPKEYDLLTFLVQNRGRALSRDDLLDRVWGLEYPGGTRTVDVHIHGLREKIERDPAHPTRIVTVRGSGYRFEG